MLKKSICEISKFTILENPHWVFSDSSMTYNIKLSIIDNNIIFLNVSGFGSSTAQREVWPKVAHTIFTQMEEHAFYLLHDYSQLKGASSWS